MDLIRHQMKGLGGHLPGSSFPPLYWGACEKPERDQKDSLSLGGDRFLVGPFGAAMVDISITRVLVMNLPFALMIFLGFDCVLGWSGANSRSVKLS